MDSYDAMACAIPCDEWAEGSCDGIAAVGCGSSDGDGTIARASGLSFGRHGVGCSVDMVACDVYSGGTHAL
ncbi:hypothetical protein D3C78_1626160 [compost metagenome]